MIVHGILKMAADLNISDRTLRKIMQQYADFPVNKSEEGHWIFNKDEVLLWWKSHYGYLEELKTGNKITASGLKKRLGVSHGTITRWMHEGMPYQKVNTSLVVIDITEARVWLENKSASTRAYSEQLG